MTTVLVYLGDQRRSRTDSHGIINFSLGLVRALPGALSSTERLIVLANPEVRAELANDFLRPGDELHMVATPRSGISRLWSDHVTVVRAARAASADVVIYPKGFLPLRFSAGRRATQVACLHDDIPARAFRDGRQSLARRLRAAYFTFLLRWSLRRADRRLFVSRFSAARLGARIGDPSGRDAVIHEGISLPRQPHRPVIERAPQALVLGSQLPHKRTAAGLRLIAGDAGLIEAIDRVVVLGFLPPGQHDLGSLAIDHRPGPLTNRDLAALIAESRVLVFPSEYEGFGLPPVESLALGTPAVFRRTAAADEILDGAPGGYREETAASFAGAVAEALALGDDDLRSLSEAMWQQFDWETVAARVVTALRADPVP